MKRKFFTVVLLLISIYIFATEKVALIINLPTDMSVTNNARQREFANNDTKSLVKALKDYCGYKTIVVDNFTNVNQIKHIFDGFVNDNQLQSFFFYYGGYGFDFNGSLYLSIDNYDENYKTRTAINYEQIMSYFKQLKNAQILSFFNYNIISNNGKMNNFSINVEKNSVIVHAGCSEVKVYENYEKQHSAFAFFLTEAMCGQADVNEDDNVSSHELISYLSHNYQSYLSRINSKPNTSIAEITYTKNYFINRQKQTQSQSINSELNSRFNEAFDAEFGDKQKQNQSASDLLKVEKVQFFNPKNLAICTEFPQKTTTYIGFDVLFKLQHLPDPQKKIVAQLYIYYPDGSLMCKLNKICQPIASIEGAMFCRAVYGWQDSGHWSVGRYKVKVSYKDSVLKTTTFEIK